MPRGHPTWREERPKCPHCGSPSFGGWVRRPSAPDAPDAAHARAAAEESRPHDTILARAERVESWQKWSAEKTKRGRPQFCGKCRQTFFFDPEHDGTVWWDSRQPRPY